MISSPHPGPEPEPEPELPVGGPNVKDVAIRERGSAAEKREEEAGEGGKKEKVWMGSCGD